jgi:hypothetical protein
MLPSSVNTSISYSAGWPLVLTTATTATEEGGWVARTRTGVSCGDASPLGLSTPPRADIGPAMHTSSCERACITNHKWHGRVVEGSPTSFCPWLRALEGDEVALR